MHWTSGGTAACSQEQVYSTSTVYLYKPYGGLSLLLYLKPLVVQRVGHFKGTQQNPAAVSRAQQQQSQVHLVWSGLWFFGSPSVVTPATFAVHGNEWQHSVHSIITHTHTIHTILLSAGGRLFTVTQWVWREQQGELASPLDKM